MKFRTKLFLVVAVIGIGIMTHFLLTPIEPVKYYTCMQPGNPPTVWSGWENHEGLPKTPYINIYMLNCFEVPNPNG